ncbi:MAG TPA: thioredoxin [Chitinophagaceae bacterium]|jgi:thioredoxin 1|nr:thioredoxin [Chitinophagaceae bacterium]
MLKKIIFTGFVVVSVIAIFAFMSGNKEESSTVAGHDGGQGIHFIEADWNKALQEARKQNKLIFLDAYASWCGPCRMLKKNTFPDKEAGEFFNKHFINVAVNMEKGDGPSLAAQYRVDAYPTLIIADADGGMVTYTKGYISPKQLIDFGSYGLSQQKK